MSAPVITAPNSGAPTTLNCDEGTSPTLTIVVFDSPIVSFTTSGPDAGLFTFTGNGGDDTTADLGLLDPAVVGTYHVTVTGENGEGTDSQDFTVEVSAVATGNRRRRVIICGG